LSVTYKFAGCATAGGPNIEKGETLSGWWWLLQRVSGVLLLGLLAVHLVLTHFVNPAEAVQFASVRSRLGISPMMLVDHSLLFLGLFHGLYGLFVVLQDLLPKQMAQRAVAWALTVLGVSLGILGAYTLAVFGQA
jgi:succinate dehydrogenase hydrophobic anchor subunit